MCHSQNISVAHTKITAVYHKFKNIKTEEKKTKYMHFTHYISNLQLTKTNICATSLT